MRLDRLVLTWVMFATGVTAYAAQGQLVPVGTPPPSRSQAPAESGTATISGVVRDAGSGAPIGGAVVYLGPGGRIPEGRPQRMMTDGRGRFVFSSLAASTDYYLQVSKPGYFHGAFGEVAGVPGRRPIAVGEGEWRGDADVELTRHGAISGRVLDERGEPVVGVIVRVLRRVFIAGSSRLAAGPEATTDDRGVYRIPGLRPGSYLVQVPSVQSSVPVSVFVEDPENPDVRPISPTTKMADVGDGHRIALAPFATPLPASNGRPTAYPSMFYPGVRTLDSAAVVELGSGEERSSVDIGLAPVETFTVAGRVDGPPGSYAGLMLRLMPEGSEALGPGSEAAMTRVASDGRFALRRVPAGTYTLIAQRTVSELRVGTDTSLSTVASMPLPPGATFSGYSNSTVLPADRVGFRTNRGRIPDDGRGRLEVSVADTDIEGLVIPLQPTATISGRYVWDPAAEPGNSFPRSILAMPANGDPALGGPRTSPTRPSGPDPAEWTLRGFLPGRFVLGLLGGRVKSIAWNGRDYTHRPFEVAPGADIADVVVTVTTSSTTVSGTVRETQGTQAGDGLVIAFPVEREQWTNYGFTSPRILTARVGSDGRYSLSNLPAGDYHVVAVDVGLANAWRDPTMLDQLAAVASHSRSTGPTP